MRRIVVTVLCSLHCVAALQHPTRPCLSRSGAFAPGGQCNAGPAPRRARAPVAVVEPTIADVGESAKRWLYDVRTKARRWLYTTLEPWDKGDFRWEFLVPWTKKKLSTTEKFIVCSTFIGLSFALQTLLDPRASVGVHLSYIAQFFSYAMGDPIGFRLLAVLTSVLEIVGNLFERKGAGAIVAGGIDFDLIKAFSSINDEDVFPLFYDQLFVVINSYYILRWLLSQEELARALEWDTDAEALYTQCFAELGFRRAQFSRLLRFATFVTVSEKEAEVLTVQGEQVLDLFVAINSTCEVRVGGAVASYLPPFQLIGEASLLENLQSPGGEAHPPARATVVAAPGSRYVRWPQSAFYELQEEEDTDFAYAIQLMIARTLSQKLSAARNSQTVAEERLTERKRAVLRGVSPAALAAQRVGDSTLEGGAAAEVSALLKQNQEKETQVRTLERSLAEAKRDLADLKLLLTLFGVGLGFLAGSSVVLGSGRLSESVVSGWSKGGELSELASYAHGTHGELVRSLGQSLLEL